MDLLNKIVEDEIKAYEINSIKELHFHERTAQIILSHLKNFNVIEYKKHYEFEECFELSHSFLKDLNKDYASLLLKRMNEGAFIVGIGEDTKDSISASTIVDGKPKMYIPYQGDLSNTFSITHEFIHDMTINNGLNNTRMTFCEVFSLYAELLQAEYLKERKINEAIIRPKEIFNGVYFKALRNAFEIELIKEKITNGAITPRIVADIVKKIDYKRNFVPILNKIFDEKLLRFGYEQRYIIGYLLTLYMRERNVYQSNKEFFDLNEKLNNYTIPEFINYLDLNGIYSETLLDLDEVSYKKIEDAYVKQLKKIR